MPEPAAHSPEVVALRGVSKWFGATAALRSVDFEVRRGEVHVLAGENGAGKSTLMKILSGVHTDYAGELRVDGQIARFVGPQDARAAGIATIHQELSLVGALSVADNFALARAGPALAPVSQRTSAREARRMLEALQVDVDPLKTVDFLPIGERQLVEIARALGRDARVFVMDEPTSALRDSDAERLFERIETLRAAGKAIVYISHRLDEIYRLADRISVLRDGCRVASGSRAELDRQALLQAMLGRGITLERRERTSSVDATPALQARDVVVRGRDRSRRRVVDGVSLSLRRGEIVGLAGLRGSGASELLHALFGSRGPLEGGRVELGGARFEPRSPRHSIARGIVLLTNDRATSVVASMSVLDNATLSKQRAVGDVVAMLSQLRVTMPALASLAARLSGGNQQKVALARCLLARPSVLLLDEPMRGVDIGAKADLHALIVELAEQGMSVLFVASEADELLALADRVLVLFRGRIVDEIPGLELAHERLARERIARATMGAGSGAA
jgi:ribose transport system ATP-binding protein